MKLTIFIFLFIELLAITYIDLKYKKISNYWSIFNIILAVIFYLFLKEEFIFSWNIFIYPLAILVAGFLMFAIKIMGAGDAKFLFSFYLLIPYWGHYSFFTCLVVMTIIIALINIAFRVTINLKTVYEGFILKNYKNVFNIILGKKMPYAPVILGAWILFALETVYDIF